MIGIAKKSGREGREPLLIRILEMTPDLFCVPNPRIEFRCTQSGVYRILSTSFDGQLGQFLLRVQEAQ